MSNLIITIISIGLVAVAAVMGIYYGGQAFQNGQTDAIANAIVDEAQQINAAQRMWATNHNQPDATGVGLNTLVTDKELTSVPAIGGNQLGAVPTGSAYDYMCYNYQGNKAAFLRDLFTYGGGNYVYYLFFAAVDGSGNCTYGANTDFTGVTPILKIAAAINTHLGTVPANTISGYVFGIPAPIQPVGSPLFGQVVTQATVQSAFEGWISHTIIGAYAITDANGNFVLQSNYCMRLPSSGRDYFVACVFGPS